MNRLILLSMISTICAGCMTVNIHNYASGQVSVQLDKAISTSTLPVALKADGNTVPVSAIP